MRPTTDVSSANLMMWLELNLAVQSWVSSVKSSGLSTQPCGAPVLSVVVLEVLWPTRTDWGLPVKKSRIQLQRELLINCTALRLNIIILYKDLWNRFTWLFRIYFSRPGKCRFIIPWFLQVFMTVRTLCITFDTIMTWNDYCGVISQPIVMCT